MTLCAVFLLVLPSSAAASAPGTSNTSPATGPPRPAGIGIRLLDVRASTQGDPRARTYIIDRIAPGAEIQRRVRVENNTTKTQTIRVYAGAAHIDGGAFIGEEAAAKNELTTWARLARPEVELVPGGATDVLVTIKVPADAAESEQYGAIRAEVRSPGTPAGEDVPPWTVWALASGAVLIALALALRLVLRARTRAVAGPRQMAGAPDSTPLEPADER